MATKPPARLREQLATYLNDPDLPTTCPHCGCRTDMIQRGERQLHWCLDPNCEFVFLAENDLADQFLAWLGDSP